MKFLLIIVLTALSFPVYSGELDAFELITPLSYKRPSSFSQTLKSKTKASLGDLVNIDVNKKVKTQIAPYANDLAAYFPASGELNQFISDVTNEGIAKHLSVTYTKNGTLYRKTEITDDGLISFYGHLGNHLIGKIADRILEKEGVRDAARRQIWVNKLTEPFNNCISTSLNSQYDANHCIEALTASLVPSAGIGLVYELSRSALNNGLPIDQRAPFNASQVVLYKACIAKTKRQAADVKTCALAAMKTGVLKVTDVSLSKTLNDKSSSAESAKAIKKVVWSSFNTCIQAVGSGSGSYTEQFMNCIDALVANTGSQLVLDKIGTNSSITSLFPPSEVKKLAIEKSAQFKKCAEQQKASGARKEGMLDIDVCENQITNEVTYKVVAATLRNNAQASFKDDAPAGHKIGHEGVGILDKCWNNQQTPAGRESCLRKTILTFSDTIASLKLSKAVPDEMQNKSQLTQESVEQLTNCLEKELPVKISEAKDLGPRIESCSSRLTKNVAMKVADFKIRASAKGNLSADQTQELVAILVNDQFEKCIGPSPTDESLQKCGDSLTIQAAKQITSKSFAKEVNAYLEKNGGVHALGLEQPHVDDFIKMLNAKTQLCLDQRPSNGSAMDHVNACIKGSIQKIALFFGDVKFKQSVGDMYAGRTAERTVIEKKFKKTLEQCLSEKDGKEHSIEDYIKNLYDCSDKVASSTSLDVGEDQIENSIKLYLQDRPGNNLSEVREGIRKNILGKFKNCIKSSPTSQQGGCIDELKRAATQSIVLNYGRAETRAQLNARETPVELKSVEKELITCTASSLAGEALSKHLEECTKNFALGFAKELGTLKLTHLLKQALGTNEFDSQNEAIAGSLERYYACLDNLKSVKMSEGLTSQLTACGKGLEERAMAIVRNNINGWMSSEEKDAATLMIKNEFANFIPCLSILLPPSPYTPLNGKNVDSILRPVSILFAQYIEYNPENAKSTLDGILQKLSSELKDIASNPHSRSELVDFLYANGTLDQFIKSMVRGEIKKSFDAISEDDVPKDLRELLLQKQNFEDMFNSAEGENIKTMVLEKVLRPVLVDQIELKSPVLLANTKLVKDSVIKLLVDSPSFGEQILKTGVQTQINKMKWYKSLGGKILYGKEAFDWSKVRLTAEGKRAEGYIKENVLLPKFKATAMSEEEKKKISAEAEELVTRAVKAYKKGV